jgi:DNA-directed RNA polymerase specialized sigma24 family protein
MPTATASWSWSKADPARRATPQATLAADGPKSGAGVRFSAHRRVGPSTLGGVGSGSTGPNENLELLEAARGGDEGAYRRLVEPHRRELHAHCYRMLGSVHDAEDALQEALLRAWRGLEKFEGRSSLRSWLYRIATNASLDAIERRPKRVLPIDYPPADPSAGPGEPLVESIWIEPYPDEAIGIEDGFAAPEPPATSGARASSWPSSRRSSTSPPPSAPC